MAFFFAFFLTSPKELSQSNVLDQHITTLRYYPEMSRYLCRNCPTGRPNETDEKTGKAGTGACSQRSSQTAR